MKRREILAVVSASAGLTGCLGRSDPSTCTQGPTAVGDVTADTEGDVTLQGTVVETMPSNDWFELADGTGRIRIVSSEIPDEDSCVRLGGVVSACPSSDADHCVEPWYWEPME